MVWRIETWKYVWHLKGSEILKNSISCSREIQSHHFWVTLHWYFPGMDHLLSSTMWYDAWDLRHTFESVIRLLIWLFKCSSLCVCEQVSIAPPNLLYFTHINKTIGREFHAFVILFHNRDYRKDGLWALILIIFLFLSVCSQRCVEIIKFQAVMFDVSSTEFQL